MLLSKEGHKLAAGEYEQDLRVYHHPQQLLQRMDFVSEVVDTMEKLGWEPYQVTAPFFYKTHFTGEFSFNIKVYIKSMDGTL